MLLVCATRSKIQPLSMPVFFQVAKNKVQTWNHRMVSVHGLLQNQLLDSSQSLTAPHDCRLTSYSFNTDLVNASPLCNQKYVWNCLSACLSKLGQPADFEMPPPIHPPHEHYPLGSNITSSDLLFYSWGCLIVQTQHSCVSSLLENPLFGQILQFMMHRN